MVRKKTKRLLIQIDRKSQVNKIKGFLNHIYQTKKYEACRQLWIRHNDNFKEAFFCKTEEFYDRLVNFVVNENCDYYLTSNAFYANRRGNENIAFMDNFVFDLDNHSQNVSSYDISRSVSRLLSVLENEYKSEFPYFISSIPTTRGVHIWLHIESIAPRLLFLWKIVANHFCDVLERVCKEENIDLQVDRKASCNASGLFRMPFTYNTATGGYIDEAMIIVRNKTYTIDELIEKYDIDKNKRRSDERNCKVNDNKSDDDGKYKALQWKRIKFIEEYVVNRNYDVIGHRNALIFLYYNACVQVMERSEALERTNKLNKSFKKQYSESEFRTVISAVDKKIYKFTNERFFSMLDLSEEELKRYREMSKYKPKVDKAERNKKIFEMAYKRMTCQQIADEIGCSVRTVKTVLKDFDKSELIATQVKKLYADGNKTQQEIADMFNISRMQVSRYLKG